MNYKEYINELTCINNNLSYHNSELHNEILILANMLNGVQEVLNTPTLHHNVPLDSHILIDTDYMRDYLNEMYDLILDDEDDDSEGAITDPDDPVIDEIINQVIYKACENDTLHDEIKSAIQDSWLWENLCNIIDDVTSAFMREQISQIKNERIKKNRV